eukprot:COSAG05_NODE_3097_length_2324_cov_31.462237_4_plen_77_part_01
MWCEQEIKLAGEAAAEAERVKGQAEAAAMQRKAEAWSKYSKATFLDKIIAQLPEITEVPWKWRDRSRGAGAHLVVNS